MTLRRMLGVFTACALHSAERSTRTLDQIVGSGQPAVDHAAYTARSTLGDASTARADARLSRTRYPTVDLYPATVEGRQTCSALIHTPGSFATAIPGCARSRDRPSAACAAQLCRQGQAAARWLPGVERLGIGLLRVAVGAGFTAAPG